jgi:hypothetical protein
MDFAGQAITILLARVRLLGLVAPSMVHVVQQMRTVGLEIVSVVHVTTLGLASVRTEPVVPVCLARIPILGSK